MSEQVGPPRTPEGLQELAVLLADPGLFDLLTGRLIEGIASRLPDLADDPELMATLSEGARAGVSAIVNQIAVGETSPVLPPATLAVAQTLARRGFGTEPLLAGFSAVRQSALTLLQELSGLLTSVSEDAASQLVDAWSYVLWLADSALEAMVAEHGRERDLLVQSRTARHMDTVRELLTSDTVDADALSNALGYPLRRHHTAIVGWVLGTGPSGSARRQASNSLAALVSEHFGGQVLLLPSGTTGVWAWLATSKEPDVREFPADALPAGVGAALGATGYGPAGFRRSHEEAVLTQRIVRSRGDGEGIHLYDDLELAGLAGANRAGMEALIQRELRGLAAGEPALQKLRDTLLAFYTANLQLAPAAAALGVHKNTVRYRLQQAEEILGRPLGERRAKVELALHCLQVYGPVLE